MYLQQDYLYEQNNFCSKKSLKLIQRSSFSLDSLLLKNSVLGSDNQYIFTKQHQHEFIQAYHEKKNDMTKTAFIRHFASKWNMSEHPLQGITEIIFFQ